MIVVAIVAIAAALVVPRFGDSSVTRLRAAAKLVAADMAFAQVGSIAHADDLRVVVFHADGGGYFIAAASDPAMPITNPVGNVPYRVTFGQGRAQALAGVVITATGVGGDDQLQFGAYGQLDQPAAATVTLTAGAASLTVTLDPVSGEATIGQINE